MANFSYSVTNEPAVTAYDADFPTRSQELLADEMIRILDEMSDAGFEFSDNRSAPYWITGFANYVKTTTEIVRNYATQAITNYRADDPPALDEPSTVLLPPPSPSDDYVTLRMSLRHWEKCFGMLQAIYYMWETEEDPLRIKDYLRDALLSVPLNDITIDLKEDSGSEMHLYPSFHTIDT